MNNFVIWVMGMLLLFCALRMMLLFVHWEYCYYLGSGDAVVDCVLEMMLLFG